MPEQQEKPKKVCKMCVVIRKVELLWHTLIKKKREVVIMSYSRNIIAYENYILGKEKFDLAPNMPKKEKFEAAKEVIRYAFSTLLEWSPEEAIHHVTKQLLCDLKLFPFIDNYYIFPDDLVRDMDYDYIVSLAYGIPVDYKFQLLKHQALIASGVEKSYKKELFSGPMGATRAAYLLMEMISTTISISDVSCQKFWGVDIY